jgi:hypothetical protein
MPVPTSTPTFCLSTYIAKKSAQSPKIYNVPEERNILSFVSKMNNFT